MIAEVIDGGQAHHDIGEAVPEREALRVGQDISHPELSEPWVEPQELIVQQPEIRIDQELLDRLGEPEDAAQGMARSSPYVHDAHVLELADRSETKLMIGALLSSVYVVRDR